MSSSINRKRDLKAAGLCIDSCGKFALPGKVRCGECNRAHAHCGATKARAKRGPLRQPKRCHRCGGLGHYRSSCNEPHPPSLRHVHGDADTGDSCGLPPPAIALWLTACDVDRATKHAHGAQ